MNKLTLPERSEFFRRKVAAIVSRLTSGIQTGNISTREQVVSETFTLLNGFKISPLSPMYEYRESYSDMMPDLSAFTSDLDKIAADLSLLFEEYENLETIISSNFNYLTTESNRLYGRLKELSSKLSDYILYATNRGDDALFLSDSFSDVTKIDVQSQFLTGKEATIFQDEGLVTLSTNTAQTKSISVSAPIVLNPASNGSLGNNHQLGSELHGTLADALDGNPDTWVEYERVVERSVNDSTPLVMDFTLDLGKAQTINCIRINPNNFGTKTPVQIKDISSSFDGSSYISIKDEIPLSGFTGIDEQNVFSLSPASSKYAGQAIYTFTPRKAKLVHIVLVQQEPYVIDTPRGERLRYAIGLRDIEIKAIAFDSKAELITRAADVTDEVKKVAIAVTQTPSVASDLGSITYAISPDDGQTWHTLRPLNADGAANEENSVPEILNFNLDTEDSIATTVPVSTLRLRATLERNDAAFDNGVATLHQELKSELERVSLPLASPFTVQLAHPALAKSLSVVVPDLGSRGYDNHRYLCPSNKASTYSLPFTTLTRQYRKVSVGGTPEGFKLEQIPWGEIISVFVNDQGWILADRPLSEYATIDPDAAYDPTLNVYSLDLVNMKLSFGDGSKTNALPDGAKVEVALSDEHLYFNRDRETLTGEVQNELWATLDFAVSSPKADVTIERFRDATSAVQLLPKGATICRLAHQHINDSTSIAVSMAAAGYAASPKTFIDGSSELSASTDWSIDLEEGILYTLTATPRTDIGVSYTYQESVVLTQDDWDFVSGRHVIKINPSAWQTEKEHVQIPLTDTITFFDLPHMHVLPGTFTPLVYTETGARVTQASLNPFIREVAFQDGVTEFGAATQPTTLPYVPVVQEGGLVDDLSGDTVGLDYVSMPADWVYGVRYPVIFDDVARKSFVRERFAKADIDRLGDYFVDSIGKKIYVAYKYNWAVAYSSIAGKMSYFVAQKVNDTGSYSVDYRMGRVYTQRPIVPVWNSVSPPYSATWSLYADYQHVDYRIKYDIGQTVSSRRYRVSPDGRSVTLDNRVADSCLLYYDYAETVREDAKELKEFFTPTLRDYVLKVVTKKQMI